MQQINKTLEEDLKLRAAPEPIYEFNRHRPTEFVKIPGESKMARRMRRRALAR